MAIGHIEIFPDPLALAHHAAEWMNSGRIGGARPFPRLALWWFYAEGALSATCFG